MSAADDLARVRERLREAYAECSRGERSIVDWSRERDRRIRELVRATIALLQAGDERFIDGIIALDHEGETARLFRTLRRQIGDDIVAPVRAAMLRIWQGHGDHLRQEVGNDLLLADVLRRLLPHYHGGAMQLFRGEGACNYRHRAYGLAWSGSQEVASSFAQGFWRHSRGGSVVLAAKVPGEAIICAIQRNGSDRYVAEKEYLVDRRRLRGVRVVERFAEVSL